VNPADCDRRRHSAPAGSRTSIRDGRQCGEAYGANKAKIHADASILAYEPMQETAAGVLAGRVAIAPKRASFESYDAFPGPSGIINCANASE
jgi:hypothetical protein